MSLFKTKQGERIKKLENENVVLKRIIEDYEKPLSLNVGLTDRAIEWSSFTEAEKVMKIRKLDLVLTFKKTGRWDYERNCAKL